MSMIFLSYRAATQARQALGILKKEGISARMDRSPTALSEKGCGYGLWVPSDRAAEAANVLRRQSRPFSRSYVFSDGGVREVQL